MKVLPEQLALVAAQPSLAPQPGPRPAAARPATPSAKQEAPSTVPNVMSPIGGQSPNVTYRRDSNGRAYYVFSEAQSGQEIQEVRAKEVRNVAQEIEEYLKQQEAKATSHLNVKA